ncbi:helix-turn-helix transcriptional regulator [Peribacillus asahii]|uniref:helix-turn-helix transcriptional regulator n=1 Tax=Peribacillus asahii TaxID=228899 RepID=UPI00380FD912
MKQFKGEIGGKKLTDFNQFDNSLTKFQERLEFVTNNINGEDGFLHSFFAEYLNQYYDVSPSQDGYLAEETSVFKLLERLGTFLIEAPDSKSHRKVEYRFWVDEREYNKYKESDNKCESSMSNGEDNNVEIIDMFVDKKNEKNQKIVRNLSVNAKDIKEIKEIRSLQDAIDYLKSPKGIKDLKEHAQKLLESGAVEDEAVNRLKYIAKNTERYINSYVKELRESQVLIKKAIKRPIEFKNILKDEGVPNKLDVVDFMEKKEVEKLLEFLPNEDLMTDIGIIIYDLGQLLKATKLSSREEEIIQMLREGLKQSEIAEELGILKQNVKTYMKRIAEKVSKTYEKQVESYRDKMRQKKN